MAVTLTLKAMLGEVVKLYHAEKAAPYYRQDETPAGAALTQATADATGLVAFPGLTSRIEYMALRPNRSFIKIMDSTTRGGSP
jgi:hypothetical protein